MLGEDSYRLFVYYSWQAVVHLDKGSKVLVSFMEITYSGNFYTPIDPNMPSTKIKKILDAFQSALIITDKENESELPEVRDMEQVDIKKELVGYIRYIDTKIIGEWDNNSVIQLCFDISVGKRTDRLIVFRNCISYVERRYA